MVYAIIEEQLPISSYPRTTVIVDSADRRAAETLAYYLTPLERMTDAVPVVSLKPAAELSRLGRYPAGIKAVTVEVDDEGTTETFSTTQPERQRVIFLYSTPLEFQYMARIAALVSAGKTKERAQLITIDKIWTLAHHPRTSERRKQELLRIMHCMEGRTA